jgi:hypothetical protein
VAIIEGDHASRQCSASGFKELGLNRIEANPLAKNSRSNNVLVKLGFTHEGTLRQRVFGVPPPLLAQFPILETALLSLGVVVWPMVEFEADDALASAAAKAAREPTVDQVVPQPPSIQTLIPR